VNGRADIVIAATAHGLHLPSDAPQPGRFRAFLPVESLIGVSCHSVADLQRAENEGANFAVFGPVFESPGKGRGVGLEQLREAVAATNLPVIALGGITPDRANACIEAGAAGFAGIRLFQVLYR
jgi:thiamine-phosphate pyrophosphorylase